jgi:hypothetical protein
MWEENPFSLVFPKRSSRRVARKCITLGDDAESRGIVPRQNQLIRKTSSIFLSKEVIAWTDKEQQNL